MENLERNDKYDTEVIDWKKHLLIREIDKRIYKENSNLNILITGEPGSGKSYAALRIACEFDPFFVDDPIIVFSVADYIKEITGDRLKKGRAIIFDEAGVGISKRQWYSVLNQAVNSTFQTMRSMNFLTILTSPFSDFIDKDTQKLIQFNIDFVKKIDKGRVFKITKRSYSETLSKFMNTYLKIKIKGKIMKYKKIIFRMKGLDNDLIKKYEKMKGDFQKKLNAKTRTATSKVMGTSYDQWNAKLEELEQIIKEIPEHKITKKIDGKIIYIPKKIEHATGCSAKLSRALADTFNIRSGVDDE